MGVNNSVVVYEHVTGIKVFDLNYVYVECDIINMLNVILQE